MLWWQHLTHLKLTQKSKSVWIISYFRPFCMGHGAWSRRNCNCVDSKTFDLFQNIVYQEHQVSFVNPQFWISHFGFYHRVQWRGAKTVSKECSWGLCHGFIPSLWDFAQNYSLQIERRDQNWRGTFYSLDSVVADCLSCSTLEADRHWIG